MIQSKKEERVFEEKAVFPARENTSDEINSKTEVENAHAAGDGALKPSDKEQAESLDRQKEERNSNY